MTAFDKRSIDLFDSGDPALYAVETAALGPQGSLPLTDAMLLDMPSGDLFGLTQNAGMGWPPAEMVGPQFLLLSRLRDAAVKVIREAYPDPTDPKVVFKAVDMKAVKPLPKPVTLAAVKAAPRLKDMALVKYSRLSVQPVSAQEWKIVCAMGGLKD